VGDKATPRHSAHANNITTRNSVVASDTALFVFVLCPLNILPVKADDGGGSGAGELRGWPAVLFPCRCRPVNRSARIVSLWSTSVHRDQRSKIHVRSPWQ